MSTNADNNTACPIDSDKNSNDDRNSGARGVNTSDETSEDCPSEKPTRKVTFPADDQLVTQYFEPANPWHDVPTKTRAQLAAEYLESCRKHNTAAIESVLEQIRELPENCIGGGTRAARLALSECRLLGSAPVDALEALLRRVQFRRIEIDNAELDDEGAEAIFDMLEYYESATTVCIGGPRQFGIRGWQAASRMVKKSADLCELEVRESPMEPSHAPVLARALRTTTCRLRTLCLHRTAVSGEPLLNLVIALKTNHSIRELRLGDNNLVASDALHIASLLRINSHIQLLDLSNNQIQDKGVGHVADALIDQSTHTPPSTVTSPVSPHHFPLIGGYEARGLAFLVLWNNQLTRNCVHHLNRALRVCVSLCVLNVGRNALGGEAVRALTRGATLISLGLQAVRLGPDAARPLAELVRADSTLQRLDLRENRLGSQSLQAILSAMKDNTTLTQIDLDDAADSTNLSVEDSEGAIVARLTRDIRAACRRNEPAPAASPDRRAHRKISLTCQTSLAINRGMQGVEEMERRGGRLRSPAPSPAGSPIPAVQADRFSVNRVTPERESSTDSSSPSTPTRTYSPSQSRFKVVQVAEPVKIPVSPKFSPGETPKQSRFSVTRNYDSIYSLTPTQTQYLSQDDSQKNIQPKQELNDSSQNKSVKIGESDKKAKFEDEVKTHVDISNDKKSSEDSIVKLKEKSKVNNEQIEKNPDKQDEIAKVDRVAGDVTKIIEAEIRITDCIPTHSNLEKDLKSKAVESNDVTNKIKSEDNIFKVKDSHENVDTTNAIRTSNVSKESSQVMDECGKMDEEPVTSVGSEFENCNPILTNEDDNKQKSQDVIQTSPVIQDLSNITNALVCKPRLDIATYPLHSEFISLPMKDIEIRVIDNDNIGDTVINERVYEVNKNVSRTEANLIKSDINSDSVCKNVNSEISDNVNENERVVNSGGVDVQCVSTQTQKVDKHSIGKEPMRQIEAITEDLSNLIQEMRDLTVKTAVLKAQNVIEIVNTNVPASYKESVVLKKNKSESSLDSPDLEVSRLMGRKFGSPFCDSSSSLEISGSSMESLSALESQNTLRPVIIQESVESDSELDRRKPVISAESSIESSSDVTPAGQMLNTSVSSNDSVSPLFGTNKKIHGSLSSLEASVSSLESKTEKVMVTSADSGIEYSLQNPSEGRDDSSNEGTLTNNSSLRDNVKRNFQDTSSPKRTSSLLDVPALKTKGLDRMRKISWVAPSASFHLTKPEEKVESKLPSHLDKLLSLFQHPTSLFSRSNSQNDEERRSASNTPPRKDSSLTSSFWSWGSSDKVEKDDSLSEDSTLSERVQVSFVDESFSKKLDSKTPSTDTDTLSEFQVTSDTGTTDAIVQNLVLSNAKRDTDLNKPNDLNILPADEENNAIKDSIPEAKEIKQKTFAAVLKASVSENSLEKQPSPEGQPVDKLSSKVIKGIKENISPENTMTESMSTSLALELSEKQKKEMETDKNSFKHDEVKVQENLAPIATIEETLDESLDIKIEKEECNIDLGKEALSLIDNNQVNETRSSLAEELKQAEYKEKMLDLSPELIIDEAVEVPEVFTAKEMKGLRSSPVIPERAKLKKSNSLEDLSARLQSLDIDKEVTKKIAFKVPESATTPRDIPERRSKLRARTGSSPKSLPESLNKPCSLSKMDSIISKKKKKVSSLGKIAKDSLLALNMSEDEIADFRKSYKLTSVESLRSLESVSEDATSNSVDSRCRSCLRTSQESLMSLDSINEDCRCSDNEKAGQSAR